MKGKAQLILTDPDSGRVVKHIEESNMVTNAVQRIFEIPQIAIMRGNASEIFGGLMPIYKYLVSGLVMLGENVAEDADNFMFPENSAIIGSAGTEYTGTAPTRGTLNLSQSGETDNGYRFVWDFAPEKAVGTIRCIGLTNLWSGNGVFNREVGGGSLLVNPYSISGGGYLPDFFYTKRLLLGQLDGNQTVYSARIGVYSVTIYRCKLPDCGAVGIKNSINDFLVPELLREDTYTIPIWPNDESYWAFDRATGLMYVFSARYSDTGAEIVNYCSVNVKNGEIRHEGEFSWTSEIFSRGTSFAVHNDLIYVSKGGDCRVFNLNDTEVDAYKFEGADNLKIMFSGGKKFVTFRNSATGQVLFTYLSHDPKFFVPTPDYYQICSGVNMPYVYVYDRLYYPEFICYKLMLRTDYLATINNLAEPLVKTDRHALQVRYEITND